MKKRGKNSKGQKRAERRVAKKVDKGKTAEIVAKLDELAVRAAKKNEENIADLFVLPPRDDCPICMLPLPLDDRNVFGASCCGKMICKGCYGANWRSVNKMHEENAKRKVPLVTPLCPFCREPATKEMKDHLARLKKGIDRDDANAMHEMADRCNCGTDVPCDPHKALELYVRAAESDAVWTSANAYYCISGHYADGSVVSKDVNKERTFLEIAARKGSHLARHALALVELGRGNVELAVEHLQVAAAAGLQEALHVLKRESLNGKLGLEELAKAYQAFQAAEDAEKSEERDHWVKVQRPKYELLESELYGTQ